MFLSTLLKFKNRFVIYFFTFKHHDDVEGSVADPHHVDADPDPACHVDPDPDPTFD
jgi:hypothetical protein